MRIHGLLSMASTLGFVKLPAGGKILDAQKICLRQIGCFFQVLKPILPVILERMFLCKGVWCLEMELLLTGDLSSGARLLLVRIVLFVIVILARLPLSAIALNSIMP